MCNMVAVEAQGISQFWGGLQIAFITGNTEVNSTSLVSPAGQIPASTRSGIAAWTP
jgi:hypothetical protein